MEICVKFEMAMGTRVGIGVMHLHGTCGAIALLAGIRGGNLSLKRSCRLIPFVH